jgi:mutator protein MutT
MAGRWECPGGKLTEGEDPYAGLQRELSEELGVTVRAARPLIRLRHQYPDRRVLLDVWQVTAFDGEPQALESQALVWARPDELPKHDLIEADRAIVTALRLPRLARVLAPGESLQSIQQRGAQTRSGRFTTQRRAGPGGAAAARNAGHRVFVLGADSCSARRSQRCDGVVLRWAGHDLHVDLSGASVGVFCEDAEGASQAVAEGAHCGDGAGRRPADRTPARTALLHPWPPCFAGWYRRAAARALQQLERMVRRPALEAAVEEVEDRLPAVDASPRKLRAACCCRVGHDLEWLAAQPGLMSSVKVGEQTLSSAIRA